MRKTWWLGTLLMGAALVVPSLAQQPATQLNSQNAPGFFTGVNPRAINTVKVDPTKAMRNNSLAKALQPSATQRSTSTFNMSNLMRPVSLGSWPPRLPTFLAGNSKMGVQPPTKFDSKVNLFNNPPKN